MQVQGTHPTCSPACWLPGRATARGEETGTEAPWPGGGGQVRGECRSTCRTDGSQVPVSTQKTERGALPVWGAGGEGRSQGSWTAWREEPQCGRRECGPAGLGLAGTGRGPVGTGPGQSWSWT